MKKIFLVVLLIAGSCALFTACSKSSSSASKSISATIDGSTFASQTTLATDSTGVVGITGTSNAQQSLALVIFNYNNTTGTYPLGTSATGTFGALNYNLGSKLYVATSGTVVVTTATTKSAIGTFSGIMYYSTTDSLLVTNGKFSIYW